MDPIDVWRTAGTLIANYGEEASFVAAKRADALLALGEMDGYQAWLRIGKAVAELERKEPREGEQSH